MREAPATVAEVERLIEAGASSASVELLINALSVEPGQKAALWVRFWSQSRRREDGTSERPRIPGLYWG